MWKYILNHLNLEKVVIDIFPLRNINTKKYLSFPKNNFTITELRTQQFERTPESDDFVSIKEAQTVGVLTLDSYKFLFKLARQGLSNNHYQR